MGASVSQSSINQSAIVQDVTNTVSNSTTTCQNGNNVAQSITMSDITINPCGGQSVDISASNTENQNITMTCYNILDNQQAILDAVSQSIGQSTGQTTDGIAEALASVHVTNTSTKTMTGNDVQTAINNLSTCVNQASSAQSITMGGTQPILINVNCGSSCPPEFNPVTGAQLWPSGYVCPAPIDVTSSNSIGQTLVQTCVENMTNAFQVTNQVVQSQEASVSQSQTGDTVATVVNSLGSAVSQVLGSVTDSLLIFLVIPLVVFLLIGGSLKGSLPDVSIGSIFMTAMWIFFIGIPFSIPGIMYCAIYYTNPATAWFLLPLGKGTLKSSVSSPNVDGNGKVIISDRETTAVFGRKKNRKASFKKYGKKMIKSFKRK